MILRTTQLQLSWKGIDCKALFGGVGTARGYLNLPELTAAAFVPNAFGAGRLYRTAGRSLNRLNRNGGQVESLAPRHTRRSVCL